MSEELSTRMALLFRCDSPIPSLYSIPKITPQLRLQRHWSSKLDFQQRQHESPRCGHQLLLGCWFESVPMQNSCFSPMLNIRHFLDPGNAIGMKIWQCYDNLAAQKWFFTDDNRIALENRGLSSFNVVKMISADLLWVQVFASTSRTVSSLIPTSFRAGNAPTTTTIRSGPDRKVIDLAAFQPFSLLLPFRTLPKTIFSPHTLKTLLRCSKTSNKYPLPDAMYWTFCIRCQ